MQRRRWLRTVTLALLAVLVFWIQSRREADLASPAADSSDGAAVVAEAFREGRSDVLVTVYGTVARELADDLEGSRHQRFILDLGNGLTLLVAHNIDLADRVPLRVGDRIRACGEYEWNERGGVLHWTHHDPRGRRDGGWIEHAGRRYE